MPSRMLLGEMRKLRRVARLTSLTAMLVLAGGILSACESSSPPPSSTTPMPAATEKPSATPTPTSTPSAEAVIVVAGADLDGLSVSASGYVAGVIATGGTCNFVFTRPELRVEASSEAEANASTTSCGVVQVPIGQFTKGAWQVVLTYTSDKLTITSPPTDLEIP